MRLLKYTSDGGLGLTEDLTTDEKVPPYAILSHTWQKGQEWTFDDLSSGNGKHKTGYQKVLFCAQQARRDGLDYCWVDTCCINKSSSAELSEAINSMFRWYQNSKKCYVYLLDVSCRDFANGGQSFRKSRWFTRGWTLQELIAPACVEFYSLEGKQIGDKSSLVQDIHSITGIPIQALQGCPLPQFSIDERMSWAKNRHTEREEDAAYSLLGIFDIHIPLLYGEKREKAFARLKRKIMKSFEARPRRRMLFTPPKRT
ncbi:HET-domain-containing protein [Paraphaeosphaeria sporulosa]|uniref:HET-domain-containing protein n=1 Tax=Paraphaeosphaeria sporulosa TaxID=1460663 RepID=A0A177CKQ0_9PLEO|nr:HET-domain-containing protein [Paraphaeosphaeria sporulosa]OAG07811.1 HET-domain-containing protein [Paraphaeosphaeria sporulosa]